MISPVMFCWALYTRGEVVVRRMLSRLLQAFDGHTPPTILFLSFFYSSPFCPEVRKRGETGARGQEKKRGA